MLFYLLLLTSGVSPLGKSGLAFFWEWMRKFWNSITSPIQCVSSWSQQGEDNIPLLTHWLLKLCSKESGSAEIYCVSSMLCDRGIPAGPMPCHWELKHELGEQIRLRNPSVVVQRCWAANFIKDVGLSLFSADILFHMEIHYGKR